MCAKTPKQLLVHCTMEDSDVDSDQATSWVRDQKTKPQHHLLTQDMRPLEYLGLCSLTEVQDKQNKVVVLYSAS